MDLQLSPEQITRQIMWNTSPFLETSMYLLTALASGIFIWGFWRRSRVWFKGKKEEFHLDRPGLRLCLTLKEIGAHLKLKQKQPEGFFHGLVFWGFVFLTFVTTMVALDYDTPLHFFYGFNYRALSFLGDLGGLMALIGISYFAFRRWIKRPAHIQSTRPFFQADGVMWTILFLLLVQGFVLEGLRLAINPAGHSDEVLAAIEKGPSFLGWFFGESIKKFGLSVELMTGLHQGIWIFHMVSTMAMIALVPFTKLSHIVLSLLNTFTQRLDSKGALRPIPFEKMQDATSFGLSKTIELTWKQRLAVDTCVECGRCEIACPANATQKPLSPKQIVVKLRDRMWSEEKNQELAAKTVFETNTFSFDELFSCTTCGACMQECPVNIEHVEMIEDMRRYLVLTEGKVPPTAGDMAKKVQNNGNPWGISQEDRFKWAEGLDVPVADPQKEIDYLYYIGCAGAYDDRNKKVVQSVIKLLKKAQVQFAVIGKEEKCNGDPVRRVGDEYTFNEIAVERVQQLNKYKFKKVVTHCPHCFHTIGKEYGAFGGHYETVHHSQLLHELIQTGKLKPTKAVGSEMVFHDPCYLGRHEGEYDAPREILKASGVALKENEKSKEKSFCCGMGGGNMWYEVNIGANMTQTRMDQLKSTSPAIATSCSYCLINFEYGKSTNDRFEKVSMKDIAEVLQEACDC